MAMTEFKHNKTILSTDFDWDSISDNFDASTKKWSVHKLKSYENGRFVITWTEV